MKKLCVLARERLGTQLMRSYSWYGLRLDGGKGVLVPKRIKYGWTNYVVCYIDKIYFYTTT